MVKVWECKEPGFSVALQNAADYVIKMGGEEVKQDSELYL